MSPGVNAAEQYCYLTTIGRRTGKAHTIEIWFAAVGDTIYLYPGCDRTLATCTAKFGNSANFGGFPFIPTKNPFGGSPIY